MAGWGLLVRVCLVNAAIGGLAALPVNLFNRLITVELALPALLPGLLVALHYAVQLTRPVWGHRSDTKGGRTPFIIGGMAIVGLGVIGAAWGIKIADGALPLAMVIWTTSYVLIGLGIGAAGTSFLALLASMTGPRKGGSATLAWLMLIAGAIFASVGTGIALEPYSPARLISVVSTVVAIALVITVAAVWKVEEGPQRSDETRTDVPLSAALRQTWADPMARRFTGFVFLSILAFYLSELILEPFMGHIHGLGPEDSTKLSGGKDGAALLGMISAGVLSQLRIGSLRFWAIAGCTISAMGLLALGAQLPLIPSTVTLGFGNGLFVVGAVGSMMQLAAAHARATGTRMGVFGAAQAIAAGLAGLVATATLDLARLSFSDSAAYALVFTVEAALFFAAALMAARIMRGTDYSQAQMVPGE
ncbi:MAG: MFS transporter [Pseudomonadota bacterium]